MKAPLHTYAFAWQQQHHHGPLSLLGIHRHSMGQALSSCLMAELLPVMLVMGDTKRSPGEALQEAAMTGRCASSAVTGC